MKNNRWWPSARALKLGLSAAALLAGAVVAYCYFGAGGGSAGSGQEPLYWVAPMDANYRRDEPGLSPMGMELVPVYEENAGQSAPGVVSLSGELHNQLGVRVAKVEQGNLALSLRTHGRVVFDKTLVTRLTPRVEGWVDMLFVTSEGERIRRGQRLFSLYSPQLVEAQERYLRALNGGDKAAIQIAEDELRVLDVGDESIERLRREGAVQQSVVFRAGKDGVLGKLFVSEDEFVEHGDPLMNIGTLERVWVELDIYESQAALIEREHPVTISSPGVPGEVWHAEVDYIHPALDAREQSLMFRAVIDNPGMVLKPNMFVRAHIALPERETALLAPRQAIIDTGYQTRAVLALGDGRYKSVAVRLGQSNGEQVEVLEGLEEGDIIVTSAQFLIDSESSKTSDFKRMTAVDEEPEYPPTWVFATVMDVLPDERQLRLKHDRIDDWQMPSMTMNFQVAEGVDMRGYRVDERVRVKVADGDPLFRVLAIELPEPGQ